MWIVSHISIYSSFQSISSCSFILAYKEMKDRVERLVVLPFSAGCTSQSSVAVTSSQPKKPKSETKAAPIITNLAKERQEGEESSSNKEKMKSGFGFLALPKQNISNGIHKLIKGIKSLSQLLVYKEENEEMEREMEIGFPTDVKHVTHIGLDGTTTTNPVKGWENHKAPEIISFPSISLRQFELAMAAQAHGPIAVDHSKLALS